MQSSELLTGGVGLGLRWDTAELLAKSGGAGTLKVS